MSGVLSCDGDNIEPVQGLTEASRTDRPLPALLATELVLRQEQEEYRKEGIEWTNIDYFNNQVHFNFRTELN